MSNVRVGVCGFPGGQARTFGDFDVVEVQQTFYEPPARTSTAARWRGRAGGNVALACKAWQLLTHEASSPTYRRLRTALSTTDRRHAGGLRWNPVTRRAWQRVGEIADAMAADAVVFQLPRSFTPSGRHVSRLRRFFSDADRGSWRIALELRGQQWTPELVEALCTELDLVHATDPFIASPASHGLQYWRLHGRPAYTYSYRYTDTDLAQLRGMLPVDLPAWVLFNNDEMADDAQRFRGMLGA